MLQSSHWTYLFMLPVHLHLVLCGAKKSLIFGTIFLLKRNLKKKRLPINLSDWSTLQIQNYVIYMWCIGLHMLYMLNAGFPLSSGDVSQKFANMTCCVFGPVVPRFSVSRNVLSSIFRFQGFGGWLKILMLDLCGDIVVYMQHSTSVSPQETACHRPALFRAWYKA